jgi:large subunit ribosomal protein L1
VICAPGSRAAKEAANAGADLIGEDEVFAAIKEGKIDFEVCVCHMASFPNMNKAGLGRVLGPKGLMPSVKLGTVVDNVGAAVRNMRSGNIYKERAGVIKMAIGQLGFSPEELRRNLSTFIGHIKKDAAALSDQVSKDIAEVVSPALISDMASFHLR